PRPLQGQPGAWCGWGRCGGGDHGFGHPSSPASASSSRRDTWRIGSITGRIVAHRNPTTRTGTQRVFDSPPLDPGSRYTYSIRARWTEDGRPVDQTRRVSGTAGAQIRVDFTSPLP